jgi:hypothetical protein
MDKVSPSGERNQQSRKAESRVPDGIRNLITSSFPSHDALPSTLLPLSRVRPGSPLVRHLNTARSSVPSSFVTTISSCSSGSECAIVIVSARGIGPESLLFSKFAVHTPVKSTLICRPITRRRKLLSAGESAANTIVWKKVRRGNALRSTLLSYDSFGETSNRLHYREMT